LNRAWKRRVLGRRSSLYFWLIYALLLFGALLLHPGRQWSLATGGVFGGLAMAWLLLPDTLRPAHISWWQLGAWGEQMTASELRSLPSEVWAVAHDVKRGAHANFDHVVGGPSVYLINSKNVRGGRVSIDGKGVRVTQLDNPQKSYRPESWIPGALSEGRALARELERTMVFPVHVYPVVAVWGAFPDEKVYVDDVLLIRGDLLVAHLSARPIDVWDPAKRDIVRRTIAGLKRA
jgi:hypothetical protein